jgi:hypothetical protein
MFLQQQNNKIGLEKVKESHCDIFFFWRGSIQCSGHARTGVHADLQDTRRTANSREII